MVLLFLSVWAVTIALNEVFFAQQPFALNDIIAALPHTMIFSLLLTVGVHFAVNRIRDALARGQSLDRQFIAELTPEVSRVIDRASQNVEGPRVFPTQGEIDSIAAKTKQQEHAAAEAEIAAEEVEALAIEQAAEDALAISPMDTPAEQAPQEPPTAEEVSPAVPQSPESPKAAPETAQPVQEVAQAQKKAPVEDTKDTRKKPKSVTLEQLEKFLIPPIFRHEEEIIAAEEDLPDLQPSSADKRPRIRPVGFDFSNTATKRKSGPSENDKIFAERRARMEERKEAQRKREEKIAALAAAARAEKEEARKIAAAEQAQQALRDRRLRKEQETPLPPPPSSIDPRALLQQRREAEDFVNNVPTLDTKHLSPIERSAKLQSMVADIAAIDAAQHAKDEEEVPPQVQAAPRKVDPRNIIKQRMAQKAMRERQMMQHPQAVKPQKHTTALGIEVVEPRAPAPVPQAEPTMVQKLAPLLEENGLVAVGTASQERRVVEYSAKEREGSHLDTHEMQRYDYHVKPKQGGGLDTSALKKANLSPAFTDPFAKKATFERIEKRSGQSQQEQFTFMKKSQEQLSAEKVLEHQRRATSENLHKIVQKVAKPGVASLQVQSQEESELKKN